MRRPGRITSLTLFIALIALLALPDGRMSFLRPTAHAAASFNVNSLSDSPDATPGDGVCADPIGGCTLRAAIQEANSLAGDDTIGFSVTGTIILNSEQLTITDNLVINGPGSNLLTLRKASNAGNRIFNVNAPAVSISGLSVMEGRGSFPSGGGGGILNAGTLSLTDVVVAESQAGGGGSGSSNGGPGGGIDNSGTLTMTNCVVSNNRSGFGTLGGNIIFDGSGGRGGGINNTGTLTMTNSTVSGNLVGTGPRQGGNEGGGIYNSGTLSLTNVTITQNHGVGASGVFNTGVAGVRNSIIAVPRFSGSDVAGPFNSLGNNIVGSPDGSTGFTDGVNGDLVGTPGSPLDPLLAPLANYGGPSPTHALLPGSVAIDAGTSAGAPAQDQRGVERAGTVDVGAFESRGFSINTTGGTPQSTTITASFNSPLQATVSSAFGEPLSGGRVTFSAPATGPSAVFGATSKVTALVSGTGATTSTLPRANGLAGSYQVTAGARGISNVAAYSLTNTPAQTNVNVTSSANPSNFGQSVTFTAGVTSPAGTPTGTVQFKDNGVEIGAPVALNAFGSASVTTSALTSGMHIITAVYSGDANFLPGQGVLAGGQRVRPTASVGDVSVSEGDAGTTDAVFTVTLSAPSTSTITVNYATGNDTAVAPGDYASATGTLIFAPGQTTRAVNVAVNGDFAPEPDETFYVHLTGLTGATLARVRGTGTIINDDPEGGRLAFSSAAFAAAEGSGSATITVSRAGDASRAVAVDYETSDLSASQRSDYSLARGTLSFGVGETTKTFVVLINQDSYAEGTEALSLTLSNPSNGAGLGGVSAATLEISDDVPESSGNPIDESGAFVRQHYHDFLNREPDAPGLAHWTNEIESCGANQQCREVRRINVSAAFFLSIEFQGTGNLVYKMYKAGFGRPVAVRRADFLADARQIQGTPAQVIVGQPGWEAQLEANKQAFALAFVQRPAFQAALGGLPPIAYINYLFANAAVSPTEQEMQAAVAAYGAGGAAGRAAALRSVADSASVAAKTNNEAFVLMQYFGYLQRDPDAAPDADHSGYFYWLSKLNEHNGNFIGAEMVRAFLSSDEYRRRFGQ